MRRIVTIVATVISLGVITIAASPDAGARFGAGTIADAAAGVASVQPAQYSGLDQRYVAPPRPASPAYTRPTYMPAGYASRYYVPHRRNYQDPTTREALNTCSFC